MNLFDRLADDDLNLLLHATILGCLRFHLEASDLEQNQPILILFKIVLVDKSNEVSDAHERHNGLFRYQSDRS